MPLQPWLIASRPKTLSAAAAPVLVGTALALRDRGDVPLRLALYALLAAMFIQIATNFINDALDFKRGADTAERLGPLRVTQAGLLPHESVMRAAYICFGLATVFGIPLISHAGWPLLAIGVISIVAAYAYTGGPYPLAYHGLGEIFVLLFFGVIAVGGTYYVLTLRYGLHVLVAGIAVGLLAVAILAINNLRDLEGDLASNKRTVAVRIGDSAARVEVAFSALLPFVLIGAFLPQRFLLTLAALPLALFLVVRVYRSRGRELNRCLAMAGSLQWIFSLLFLAAALI